MKQIFSGLKIFIPENDSSGLKFWAVNQLQTARTTTKITKVKDLTLIF